jgi:3-oxoacyl-[acyl-carrier protein] reductase
VTGAARGIGAAVTTALAAAGAEVVAFDLVKAHETVAGITTAGGSARAEILDVTDRQAVETAFGALEGLDVVVTSAGVFGEPIPIADLVEAEVDRVMNVNFKGTLWTIRAALPLLRDGGGRVVCLGSAAGQVGGVSSGPHYVASKGALQAMVKWLARTEASNGVLANAVAPGAIDTEMIAGRGYDGGYCPLGRLGTAEEVAEAVVFLCSPASRYITGTVLNVNGGFFMG